MMNTDHCRTDIPILLLHSIDPSWPQEDIQACQDSVNLLTNALIEIGHPVQEICVQSADLKPTLERYNPADYLVFNWCEELPRIPRSSALVAQTLEAMGFTFTGADSQALAFSQDKRLVKQRLCSLDIPTPQWKVFTTACSEGWDRFPAIVKPAFEHCSLGVTREAVVRSSVELEARIGYVLDAFSQPALVEEFVDGREFHVTILGNGVLHTLPTAEMDFSAFQDLKDRLCTYESKFNSTSPSYNLIELRLPAILTLDQQRLLERTALAAYRATNCRDYARLDIRLREGIFYVLDVNPNADISPDTSLALAAEEDGLSYGQLGSLLINLAAQRHLIFGSVY